jgi:hypothetical protein
MFRLIQIIQNLFIRLEGFLTYQLRKLFSFLYQSFGFFSKLFGFTESKYFLENEAKNIKQAETKQLSEAESGKAPSSPALTRRRPDAKMDYYLKLAQPKKTSN